MASEVYSSLPIATASKEIRLIELLPGREDEPISCIFHRCALGSPDLEYTALSYTWGDPKSPKYKILINNHAFNVRQNLWHFLKQGRQFGRCGLLWIDAMSVDQSDINERNHQVALMRDIYSQASHVFIWLGPAAEESDCAIKRIRRFPSKAAGKISRPIWSHQEGQAILALFSRKYWRRVWITQEIVLARELIVLCDTKRFHWTSIKALSTELEQINEARIRHHPLAGAVQASDALRLCAQRDLWTNLPSFNKRLELQELLETHQNTECTDIRDKVFGFLGLTSAPGMPPIFLADYSKSVNEVYGQTLRYLYVRSYGSDKRLLNPSLFRKFAVLLQHSLKLNYLEDFAESKINRILAETGEEHPSTLTSIANLASMYRNQGRWKEAEELDMQVNETVKTVLREEHLHRSIGGGSKEDKEDSISLQEALEPHYTHTR